MSVLGIFSRVVAPPTGIGNSAAKHFNERRQTLVVHLFAAKLFLRKRSNSDFSRQKF